MKTRKRKRKSCSCENIREAIENQHETCVQNYYPGTARPCRRHLFQLAHKYPNSLCELLRLDERWQNQAGPYHQPRFLAQCSSSNLTYLWDQEKIEVEHLVETLRVAPLNETLKWWFLTNDWLSEIPTATEQKVLVFKLAKTAVRFAMKGLLDFLQPYLSMDQATELLIRALIEKNEEILKILMKIGANPLAFSSKIYNKVSCAVGLCEDLYQDEKDNQAITNMQKVIDLMEILLFDGQWSIGDQVKGRCVTLAQQQRQFKLEQQRAKILVFDRVLCDDALNKIQSFCELE